MALKARDMSVDQFRRLAQDSLKEALGEVLDDPDAGLELRPALVRRLRKTLDHLDSGGETTTAEDWQRNKTTHYR